jgi:hypothetical protein
MYALFAAAWEAAADPGSYLRGDVPELGPQAQAILRALGAGLTDEAAARQLGTSLRTYRRRVAELMTALEAGSRFQAGLRAGELGLMHAERTGGDSLSGSLSSLDQVGDQLACESASFGDRVSSGEDGLSGMPQAGKLHMR